MCIPNAIAASATTGSGAPFAFGGSSPSPLSGLATPGNATLALGAAGAFSSAVGAISSSLNTRTADQAQADAAATNALISERAAASAVTTGIATATNTETKGAQTIASQRAALGANGVDVNSGTAAAVQASTKYITDQNVDTITANAARTAMGYTQQEQNNINSAGALRAAAEGVSPTMSGATSLLTSASSVASNWYRNQRTGVA